MRCSRTFSHKTTRLRKFIIARTSPSCETTNPTLSELVPQYLIIERCRMPNCSGLRALVFLPPVFSAFTTFPGSLESLISTPNPRSRRLESNQISPSTRDNDIRKRMHPVSSSIAASSWSSIIDWSRCRLTGISSDSVLIYSLKILSRRCVLLIVLAPTEVSASAKRG